jgi:hypothetical protein
MKIEQNKREEKKRLVGHVVPVIKISNEVRYFRPALLAWLSMTCLTLSYTTKLIVGLETSISDDPPNEQEKKEKKKQATFFI